MPASEVSADSRDAWQAIVVGTSSSVFAVYQELLLTDVLSAQALEQRRHLLRLWVSPPPPDRPLPEAFAELFDSVDAGSRGGIHVPGYKLTTPFDGE